MVTWSLTSQDFPVSLQIYGHATSSRLQYSGDITAGLCPAALLRTSNCQPSFQLLWILGLLGRDTKSGNQWRRVCCCEIIPRTPETGSTGVGWVMWGKQDLSQVPRSPELETDTGGSRSWAPSFWSGWVDHRSQILPPSYCDMLIVLPLGFFI